MQRLKVLEEVKSLSVMIRVWNLLLFYMVFKYGISWGCEKHENLGENGTSFIWKFTKNCLPFGKIMSLRWRSGSSSHLSLNGHSEPPVSAALRASESAEPASKSAVGHIQAFFKSNTHYEVTNYFLFIFPFLKFRTLY